MDRQIVDPDPGLNYNAEISPGDPPFKMKKKIYISQEIVTSKNDHYLTSHHN